MRRFFVHHHQKAPHLFVPYAETTGLFLNDYYKATENINAFNPTRADANTIADALAEYVEVMDKDIYREYLEKRREFGGGVKYSLVGMNDNGIEVYETSKEIMALSWSERKAKYLDVMKNEYQGRTAKFERNGHIYYATFDQGSIRKPIYGDKRSSPNGVKALIKAGADGDVFNLVENAKYDGGKVNTKDHTDADYFDYFVKTVQIDGKVFNLVADVEKKYGVDGGYVYTLALVDNKKIKASPAHGHSNIEPVQDAGNTFVPIIPQTEGKVNTFEEKNQKNSLSFEDESPTRIRGGIYGEDVILKDAPMKQTVVEVKDLRDPTKVPFLFIILQYTLPTQQR